MNKYQNYLMDKINIIYYQENDKSKGGKAYCDTKIVVKQGEDITITKYLLNIIKETFIRSVEYNYNNEWNEVDYVNYSYDKSIKLYTIPIDFDDRITEIKITFINNIVEPIVLPIEYVEADKEVYYAKKESERKEAMLKAAAVTHEVGKDLVNIFFQPCSSDYYRTEIDLYYQNRLLANYKVNQDEFFKAIDKLAYSTFFYVLRQYNTDDKVLIETDKIKFRITGHFSGDPSKLLF